MNKRTILYFEDSDENAEAVMELLNPLVGDFALVERFQSSENSAEQTYDARLINEIRKRAADGREVVFILSDADLSKINSFVGLSEANVNKVAGTLGVPAAFYSSNLTGTHFLKADQAGDGRILLDKSNLQAMAVEVDLLVRGFCTISDRLLKLASLPQDERPKTTAALLAHLIGRPDLVHRISLFISGDQRVGAELLASPDHNILRQATIFGTWIYDSLLKYPGLVVNEVAAASYLDIAVDDFSKNEVRKLFDVAVYEGPFHSSNKPLWWRDMLDEALLDAEVEDGGELAEKFLGQKLAPCICSESGQTPAGFYCMVTRLPVSEDESVGGISWFPPGADLARIASSKYDELAPWLGI